MDNVKIHEPLGNSDHNQIHFDINVKSESKNKKHIGETSTNGFLKARSCLTNLLCFFEEITKWVDDGSPVDVVYLDF